MGTPSPPSSPPSSGLGPKPAQHVNRALPHVAREGLELSARHQHVGGEAPVLSGRLGGVDAEGSAVDGGGCVVVHPVGAAHALAGVSVCVAPLGPASSAPVEGT